MTKRPERPAKKKMGKVVIKRSTTTTKTTQSPEQPKKSTQEKKTVVKEETQKFVRDTATTSAVSSAATTAETSPPPEKPAVPVPPKKAASNGSKIWIPAMLGIVVIAAALFGCTHLPGCKSEKTGVKVGATTSSKKPVEQNVTKETPPPAPSTNSTVKTALVGLLTATKEALTPSTPIEDTLKEVSVTNNVTGATTVINVSGGTVNGGINVFNGLVTQGTSSGKKTTVSPGDVTEDTFREVTPGTPSIILGPGEIAYINFRAGLKNFKFTYDEDRKLDVRALYDGHTLTAKSDPQNTQRVTIENTAKKNPLKLNFSW